MPEENQPDHVQNVDSILNGTYESASSENSAPENNEHLESNVEYEAKEDKEVHDKTNDSQDEEKPSEDVDDYGNKTSKDEKLYTRDEVNQEINRAIRKRFGDKQQPNNEQQQQIQDSVNNDFEYDSNSAQSYQKQLEDFIEQTFIKVQNKMAVKRQKEIEETNQKEFEDKFHRGMSRFNDFNEVVANQPITNDMVNATRGLEDPAAFLYAASKLHPEELSRISKIADPYKQVSEMTRLEQRMRVNKKQSRAATPPSATPEGKQSVGDESIDALIQKKAMEKAKMRGWM